MEIFSIYKSKKTSESGVWMPDDEATHCYCCGVAFTLMIRKHHCRQCGQVCCGPCSENRTFLESSRSGAPKRICNKCYNKERGIGEDDVDDATRRVGAMSTSTAAGDAAPAAAPAARAAVSNEEAIAALKAHAFEGDWCIKLYFNMVDMARAGDALASGVAVGAFKSAAGKGRKSAVDIVPRAGSTMKVEVQLETKGAAYFKGSCDDFGIFGRDGKVNGALQRGTGKVNMTVQVVYMKTTTSFNFVGMLNKAGVFSGTFSGCEISKTAGSVAGTFRMSRTDGDDEPEDDGSTETEDDSPKKKGKKGAKKPSSRHASDEDEAEEEPKKKKPAKKAAADSDDDDEEEEKRPASKRPSMKKSASSRVVDEDDDEDEAPAKSKKKPAKKAAPESDDDDSDD